MSARFLGIGLLSLGGLVVGAAGGYLALKSDVPPTTHVEAAPVATPTPEAEAPPVNAEPPANEVPTLPASRVESRPTSMRTPSRSKAPAPRVASPVESSPPAADSAASSAAAPPVTQPVSTPASDPANATAVADPRSTPEPAVATAATTAESRQFDFEELTVARHSVIGIRLDAPVSSRTARVEDRVTATVSRDVNVDGRTAIAAGVRLEGTIVTVEHGGRFKTRPRLGLQFDRMILADGTRVNLKTDTIYREGGSPTADATAKVGTGAVAGAILGGMIGGKKGAIIGSTVGAAGGVATVMRGDGNEASLPVGAPLTVRLTDDVAVRLKR